MKKLIIISCLLLFTRNIHAQIAYTMGFDKMDINITNPGFFSKYQLTDMPGVCGIYDKNSATFYSCDFQTYRDIDDDFIKEENETCCEKIDFDPKKYYGTLTLKGVIEHVEWDSMVVYFRTDKAQLRLVVDYREIDELYKKFYKENHLGKVHIMLTLKTYDTPNENILSYNKNTEVKRKPVRIFTRLLRW